MYSYLCASCLIKKLPCNGPFLCFLAASLWRPTVGKAFPGLHYRSLCLCPIVSLRAGLPLSLCPEPCEPSVGSGSRCGARLAEASLGAVLRQSAAICTGVGTAYSSFMGKMSHNKDTNLLPIRARYSTTASPGYIFLQTLSTRLFRELRECYSRSSPNELSQTIRSFAFL
jgi:hypothetical protein